MKKCLSFVLALLIGSQMVGAQVLVPNKIPKYNGDDDWGSSIAANRYGDIMICYANAKEGAMYYFKEHGTNVWIGPAPIPGQPYGQGWGSDIWSTDMAVTRNGNFHLIWTMLDSGDQSGIHYAMYDRKARAWTEQRHVVAGRDKTEEPAIASNPKTGDVIVAWTWVRWANKDIVLKAKGANGWSDAIDVSIGGYADTNAGLGCDGEGRTCVVYKTDRLVKGGNPQNDADWELVIKLHLLDEKNDYRTLWSDELTWDLYGHHYLPTVAVLNGGRGMAVYTWRQRGGYYYVYFEVINNEVQFDAATLADCFLAQAPLHPHYMFHSKVFSYIDEFLFAYKTPSHSISMLRWRNGRWSTAAVDLSGGEATLTYFPFDCFVEPLVGIMTTWTTGGVISFSIYDDTRIIVEPPVNFKLEHKVERSFFKSFHVRLLTWNDDPFNKEKNINVVKYLIYRKANENQAYTQIAEVPGSVFSFIDADKPDSGGAWRYAVRAVDDKGNQSNLAETNG